jgi:hypothetical protein
MGHYMGLHWKAYISSQSHRKYSAPSSLLTKTKLQYILQFRSKVELVITYCQDIADHPAKTWLTLAQIHFPMRETNLLHNFQFFGDRRKPLSPMNQTRHLNLVRFLQTAN